MEISGSDHQNRSPTTPATLEEHDLSMRKLNDFQAQLRNLQKEKSERLHHVLEFVNEIRSLCGILGFDFGKTVDEVHHGLHDPGLGKSTNITTLEGLAQTIQKLKTKKKTEAEVERLMKFKVSRMKELVLKRRIELEEICRKAHIEPDMSITPEKPCAMIDSCLVDPSKLVANIEPQILQAKEESMIRKDITDKINKWQAACEEEIWLEEYKQDENRYNAGRGSPLNLKRAEKARVTVSKISGSPSFYLGRVQTY